LQNVKVQRNDELSALYAEAVANIVHVTLADGRTLTKRVDYPLGNAKNRLKDTELEGKFHSLADAKIGKQSADRVVEAGWKFDEATDVTMLMNLCEVRG
jgi:2-methylcitrate dehydratase PrpD